MASLAPIFYLLVTLHLTLLPVPQAGVTVSAQPSANGGITWQRTYGGPNIEYGEAVVQTPDNGYIAISSTYRGMWIIRLTPYGDTIWTKLQPGSGPAIEKTTDNNYVLLSGDTKVTKININGDILWTRRPTDNSLIAASIKQSNDGGYVVCGKRNTSYVTQHPYLLKISAQGTFQWDTTYITGIFDGGFSDMTIATDGNFVLVGTYEDINLTGTKTLLMKTNTQGSQIWFRSYDSLFYTQNISNTCNGGFVTVGFGNTLTYIPVLTEFDSNGMKIWSKIVDLGNPGYTKCNSFTGTQDCGYSLTGIWDSSGNEVYYVLLVKTDSAGVVEWHNSFGFNNADAGNNIRQTSDSGYIIVGDRINYNGDDIYIIKTDKVGYANPIGIKLLEKQIPENFVLYQNYPNPFNSTTVIRFDIPEKTDVRITIFDIEGQEVEVLVRHLLNAGSYNVKWDGTNFASGIYFYVLKYEDKALAKKLVLVK
jgi:hypothetical protein